MNKDDKKYILVAIDTFEKVSKMSDTKVLQEMKKRSFDRIRYIINKE